MNSRLLQRAAEILYDHDIDSYEVLEDLNNIQLNEFYDMSTINTLEDVYYSLKPVSFSDNIHTELKELIDLVIGKIADRI